MIEKIFEWAWKNGLNVRLESKNYYAPVVDDNNYRVVPREDCNFVTHNKTVLEHPVLIFSRGDRSTSITARNWAEMVELLKFRHQKIAADLVINELRW